MALVNHFDWIRASEALNNVRGQSGQIKCFVGGRFKGRVEAQKLFTERLSLSLLCEQHRRFCGAGVDVCRADGCVSVSSSALCRAEWNAGL